MLQSMYRFTCLIDNKDYIMCDNLLCPECGCPEVIVYDDGTCECQGCGFVGSIDMFMS